MVKIRSWVAAGAVALFLFGATACTDDAPDPGSSVTTSVPDSFDPGELDTGTFDPDDLVPDELDTDVPLPDGLDTEVPLPDDLDTGTSLPDSLDTDTSLPDTGGVESAPDYEHDCGISGNPECNITVPPPDIGPWD